MIAMILFIASLVITFALTRRSLGAGLAGAITVGYFHGLIRANDVSPFTSFMFDAALLGLYAGALLRCPALQRRFWQTQLGRWVMLLVLWPAVMAIIPVNHPLIQLVAFHTTVWFALMLIIGSQFTMRDLQTTGRWIAVMNIVALAFGTYIYVYGVPSLYPLNPITAFTYQSRDVAGENWRIPSTFLLAHSYGGAMIMSLPFLAAIGFESARRWDKSLAIVGTIGALGGLLLCGARQPIVTFLFALVIALIVGRANARLLFVVIIAVALATFVASQDERFQRALTLLDTDFLQNRVQISANSSFFDLILKYPFGAGMGSAWGTNIPAFLADYAPEQIGLENEFSKILINMGIIGLASWIGFLIWYLCQVPSRRGTQKVPMAIALAYGLTASYWLTAWIGSGTASTVPMSAMMFLLQGVVVAKAWRTPGHVADVQAGIPSMSLSRERPFAALGSRLR